jgi:hypothetical protein
MQQRLNMNFCAELQKSRTDQKPVREVENEELPKVIEATDVISPRTK